MKMVERFLLLQLESERMDEVQSAFAISDIQNVPTGDERPSVSQLWQ